MEGGRRTWQYVATSLSRARPGREEENEGDGRFSAACSNNAGSRLLPGDAVARAHAHDMLDFFFWIIGDVSHLNATRLRVPYENIGPEAET